MATAQADLVEGWKRQQPAIRVLRAFLGVTFLYAGGQKLADPNFLHAGSIDYIGQQLKSFSEGSPIAPMLHALAHVPVLTGIAIALIEVASARRSDWHGSGPRPGLVAAGLGRRGERHSDRVPRQRAGRECDRIHGSGGLPRRAAPPGPGSRRRLQPDLHARGCLVQFDQQADVLVCPCHGASFDPTRGAAVIAGPAPTPLRAVPVAIDQAIGKAVATG